VAAPCFELTLNVASRVVVGLHQEDERVKSAKPYLDVSLAVLTRTQKGDGCSSCSSSSSSSSSGYSSKEPPRDVSQEHRGNTFGGSDSSLCGGGSSPGGGGDSASGVAGDEAGSRAVFALVAACGPSAERQVQLQCACLPAGTYFLVPTSTGCRFAQAKQHLVPW
jgi:hypothetical protein